MRRFVVFTYGIFEGRNRDLIPVPTSILKSVFNAVLTLFAISDKGTTCVE